MNIKNFKHMHKNKVIIQIMKLMVLVVILKNDKNDTDCTKMIIMWSNSDNYCNYNDDINIRVEKNIKMALPI